MDADKREQCVTRILCKKTYVRVKSKRYCIVSPTLEIQHEANEFYSEIIEENKFNGWPTKKSVLPILIKNGIWSKESSSNLKEIEKRIEDLKVDLYNSVLRPDSNKRTRKTLNAVKNKYVEMLERRHSLDYITLEGYAAYMKSLYIYSKTITGPNGPITTDNFPLLQSIISKANKYILEESDYRELARTEPWRPYWNSYKQNPFSIETITKCQKTLVLYSQMYDNVYEHPECPSDDIVNDDDMLDGWLIINKRKREKNKITDQFNKSGMAEKHSKADNLFIPVSNKPTSNIVNSKGEEIPTTQFTREQVEKLNDTQSKIIKKQREQVIKAKGVVKPNEFADVKQELQLQSNQKYIQTVKGNKS